MSFNSLLLMSLALSLDAFALSLSIGLNNRIKFKNKFNFSLSFGFFQFLFFVIGSYSGLLFNTYIASVPQIVGGAIVIIVGVLMIKEGSFNKDCNILLKAKMYFILGICVSIDAIVIGFTVFNDIKNFTTVLANIIFIAVITFFMSIIAFILAKYLRKIEKAKEYADYIGGIIIVFFGIKMIFF